MNTTAELAQLLARIDGRGYKAYKELRGTYALGAGAVLLIDHVQGDPFAAPSKLRFRLDAEAAQLPPDLYDSPVRRRALADFLTRSVFRQLQDLARRGNGKSGLIRIDVGGQEVLTRTSIRLETDFVEARLEVGLPAVGRRVLGREAQTLLCRDLPQRLLAGLAWEQLDRDWARVFVDCVDNQDGLRLQLAERGLIAFVADGAILPRESGVSQQPKTDALPFLAPKELRVTLNLRHPIGGTEGAKAGDEARTQLSGMGIPPGITLIVGGGYHGKSTLLQALARGIYDVVPGDGREYVVSLPETVKIRAEDGRAVSGTDISGFIDHLPLGRDTRAFFTDDASGSTSQAAGIVEAVEVGARCLLLDEDTSATNFMIRDARMQALVAAENEPITPFLDRVRELYEQRGVSTILVMGGSGDYFEVADEVILMKAYQPEVVTARVHEIQKLLPGRRQLEIHAPMAIKARCLSADGLHAVRGNREVNINARGLDLLSYGAQDLDLRALEQLVDRSQTRAVGYALHHAKRWMDGRTELAEICRRLEALFDREGLDVLDPFRKGEEHPGDFARPRVLEIAMALNRLRSLRVST